MRFFQRALLTTLLTGVLGATLFSGRTPPVQTAPAAAPAAADQTYLSDLPWERASTEWLKVGYEGMPAVDSSFYTGDPLKIGDQVFGKGFGAYAPSEIVYSLKGRYSRFEVTLGVQDDALPGKATARFLIFLDGSKAYESPLMGKDDDPQQVELPIETIDELRLVAIRGEDADRGARVDWADARVLRGSSGVSGTAGGFLRQLRGSERSRAQERTVQAQSLDEQARKEIAALKTQNPLLGPSVLPRVGYDKGAGTVSLFNNRLSVTFGLRERATGTFTVLDLGRQRIVARNLSSSIVLPDKTSISLPQDSSYRDEDSFTTEAINHPVLGPGVRLRIPLAVIRLGLRAALDLTMFQDSSVLLYQIELEQFAGKADSLLFHFVDENSEGYFQVGEQVHYLADAIRLRHVITYDDGVRHQDYSGWGKPIYMWSAKDQRGLLVALLDESVTPPLFTYTQNPGKITAQVGVSATGGSTAGPEENVIQSPLFYLELTNGSTWQQRFAQYRALMANLYPSPPLPAWFKYQWLSWYVYYMSITEDDIVRQIDLISEHFSDLGPWHILVDAGWYVAEGRDGAEWRNQDWEKFPHGMRWLVDYAHARGIHAVLYFNAPYLDSLQSEGDWMGLRSIVEDHPEWLISLDDGDANVDYLYDFQNPGLRTYLSEVMRDYFVRYDVDGIKIDGLGNGADTVLYSEEGAAFGLSGRSLSQTMEIYRFIFEQATLYKDGVYVESGWVTPTLANPYSHTFRYGDEDPRYSRIYPLPGLIEHIDYAAYQQALLGQRANMGAIYGDPNESAVNLWWLEASLALGTQVVLSFDLGILSPETISQYRALLAPYRPFEGETIIDNSLEQQVFSTRINDTWYVGVLNRESGPRGITLRPSLLGIPAGTSLVAYDVEAGTAQFLDDSNPLTVHMQPESFRLLVLRTQSGLLWTNSHIEVLPQDGGLSYSVAGPPTVDGFAYVYSSAPQAVHWDDRELQPTESPFDGQSGYFYNPETSVLTLWFPPGGEHTLGIAN